jgi:hypothetical protein
MQNWLNKTEKFKSVAHKILRIHENSKSRIIALSSSYENLNILNIKQDDLFRQAFTCLERECFRASHVMAWAAFMDYIEEKLFEDKGKKLQGLRPLWKASSPEDIRENVNEYQIIDVLDLVGLCVKSEKKALHGLLNKRNECAHPSEYFPGLNDGLGYITELLNRINMLKKKTIK